MRMYVLVYCIFLCITKKPCTYTIRLKLIRLKLKPQYIQRILKTKYPQNNTSFLRFVFIFEKKNHLLILFSLLFLLQFIFSIVDINRFTYELVKLVCVLVEIAMIRKLKKAKTKRQQNLNYFIEIMTKKLYGHIIARSHIVSTSRSQLNTRYTQMIWYFHNVNHIHISIHSHFLSLALFSLLTNRTANIDSEMIRNCACKNRPILFMYTL